MNKRFLKKPLVSIIIPTYNEQEDIRKTLEACILLSYSPKEIVVVDDSNDATPQIVKEYEKKGVRLIHRETNEHGRSGARNVGILESRGEILIILNADVILPSDFIKRILVHYRRGADYVLVASQVINQENVFARFVQGESDYSYRGRGKFEKVGWTEGFSCKKSAILKVGMFPVLPKPLILKAGEDGYLEKKLKRQGFKKVIDYSIKVGHFAPSTLKYFWRTQKERVSVLAGYFLQGRSMAEEVFRFLGRIVTTFLEVFLVFPIILRAWGISSFSKRKWRDILPFSFVLAIKEMASLAGKAQTLKELIIFKLDFL